MRVFVAGASGAIGTRLVPQLIERGHEVIGTYRSPGSAERVRALGREPIALDLLDARAVREAVLEAEPEAIIHEATALANVALLAEPRPGRSSRPTGCGPRAPTRCSPPHARRASAGSSPRASRACATCARAGRSRPRTIRSTPTPCRAMRETSAAMRHLEEAVTAAGGIALRYGGFYGADNDGLVGPVRKRQFPIVGDGGGVTVVHPPRRRRRCDRARARARRGRRSTTSSTTSLRRCASGCPCWRPRSAPSRRATFPLWLGAAGRGRARRA